MNLSRCISPLKKLKNMHNLLLFFTYSTTTTTINANKPTQPSPPPIQVLLTESAGRGVFATRRIGAGDLIHTEKPIVSYPSQSLVHSVCYFCLKRLGNNKDSLQGHSVKFCSNECREQAKGFYEIEERVDWSAYDEHCRKLGLKYPLLVKRLACMVVSGAASAQCLDILQPARLLTQMILEMEDEFSLLKSCLMKANFKDEQMACILCNLSKCYGYYFFCYGPTYGSLLGTLNRKLSPYQGMVYWCTGSIQYQCLFALMLLEDHHMRIYSYQQLPLLKLKRLLATLYPNAHIIWIENVNARLKALRDIEEGEELRICYIDASMEHNARQNILFEGFGFRCGCNRCLSGD
ncbi:hypothetical protein IFM89_022903 [Coptis chinensis]|uniref:SET domain-containing protein n=1 Tax=Coptis chinensis TaxID=261450 RepID=A0A835LI79_9MAGN|nr:hypothetical protein IFM89_022903 [Coptis chinensis]